MMPDSIRKLANKLRPRLDRAKKDGRATVVVKIDELEQLLNHHEAVRALKQRQWVIEQRLKATVEAIETAHSIQIAKQRRIADFVKTVGTHMQVSANELLTIQGGNP